MINYITDADSIALDKNVRNIETQIRFKKPDSTQDFYLYENNITSVKIERMGENGKLSGFGVCQKATIKFIPNGVLNLTPQVKFHIDFCASGRGTFRSPAPWFYIYSQETDQATGEVTIVGYDALYQASTLTLADLNLTSGYTIYSLTQEIMKKLNLYGNPVFDRHNDPNFQLNYETGANFSKDKTETLREVLDDIAEITSTIYYLTENSSLCFKRLGASGIRFKYDKRAWSCEVGKRHIIKRIVSVTELGDNISAEVENRYAGVEDTVYIRDNPFITLRNDAGTILTNCATAMKNMYADEVKIEWNGYYPLEIGDGIELELSEDQDIVLRMTNDIIEVNPGYQQISSWTAKQDNAETPANPATLGEKLNQTYARVDKANQKIELAVKDIEGNKEAITGITVEQGKISSSVSDLDGKYNKITHTLDGVVYDNGSGTTVINGDNITTGKVQATNINLSGAITWDDCNSDLQSTITASRVPSYITNNITKTKVNGVEIKSPTITGNAIKATDSFQIVELNADETVKSSYGYMGQGQGAVLDGTNGTVNPTTGIILAAGAKNNGMYGTKPYLIVTEAGIRMTAGNNSLYVTANNGCWAENQKQSIKLDSSGGGGEVTVHAVWGA